MRHDAGNGAHTRSGRRWRAGVGAALALGLLAAACGDDGEDDADEELAEETPTTTTSQPPATDTEAALAAVQDLADQESRLLEQLHGRPTVIDDPDSDEMEQYTDLYTDDAIAPENVEDELRTLIDRGHVMRPGPSGVFSEYHLYGPEYEGDDVLIYSVCAIEDRRAYEAEGADEDLGGATVLRRGTGEAHRIDGVWRLHEWLPVGDPLTRDPELIEPGACESLAELPSPEELIEGDES
jgi:hypothetical protein